MNLHQPVFPLTGKSRIIRPDDAPEYIGCIDGRLIRGPGDELIGADEHKRRLVALAPISAAVANDLERNTQRRGGSLEIAQHASVRIEAEERETLAEFFEDMTPRGERLRRQMMSRPRFETMRAHRVAAAIRRPPHDGRALII